MPYSMLIGFGQESIQGPRCVGVLRLNVWEFCMVAFPSQVGAQVSASIPPSQAIVVPSIKGTDSAGTRLSCLSPMLLLQQVHICCSQCNVLYLATTTRDHCCQQPPSHGCMRQISVCVVLSMYEQRVSLMVLFCFSLCL
jgi:hypothetical protein